MSYREDYLQRVREVNPAIEQSVSSTINEIIPKHVKNFDFKSHKNGLLLGNVQSGKTGQMLGIVSAAADEGFKLFLLFTSDNVTLQEQTYIRVLRSFSHFNICTESDELRFRHIELKQPTIIILKKNSRKLETWRDILGNSEFCNGHPLFIVDDEADAASLNTQVNHPNRPRSTISRIIDEIRALNHFSSTFYLQVTATPQAILLLTQASGQKPSFVHYVSPGDNYLGGDFFYGENGSSAIRLTQDDELDDLLTHGEPIPDGFRSSVLTFLLTSAHVILSKSKKVCNFLIHPSSRTDDHATIANKIETFLNDLLIAVLEGGLERDLEEIWEDLQQTQPDLKSFYSLYKFIEESLQEEKYNTIVYNSASSDDRNTEEGMNIIIGGNSLGRGVTFPSLQTVYYCRTARTIQADTYWQHCRMYGYDRIPGLMRVFTPPLLYDRFQSLNRGNQAIIGQIVKANGNFSLLNFITLRPTRTNVVDASALNIIPGGTNFFPTYPISDNVLAIDELVKTLKYHVGTYNIENISFAIKLMQNLGSEEEDDWDQKLYLNALEALQGANSNTEIIIIIRKGRRISKNSRTLLSQTDRELGQRFANITVLTLYRVEDAQGWEKLPVWIPNIKFPHNLTFYESDG